MVQTTFSANFCCAHSFPPRLQLNEFLIRLLQIFIKKSDLRIETPYLERSLVRSNRH